MEDGILTDGQGRQVNFKNAILVMTSNVGARNIVSKRSALGFNTSDAGEEAKTHQMVLDELQKTFRPEFLNRVDDIIIFSKLSEEDIEKIAVNMLSNVAKRVEEQDIILTWNDDVIKLLAKNGYNPVYGARPLRRAIRSMIEDLLSEELLEKKIQKGDQVLAVVEDGKVVLQKQ
ncbi:MAG TPA: ATP-dependent Clp protease ATP-binding subunit, partial [Clostridiales bacterium]|nr:ATP-dependent Clp protease ATP-binding subunit [Clostridiales bacterium]